MLFDVQPEALYEGVINPLSLLVGLEIVTTRRVVPDPEHGANSVKTTWRQGALRYW